MSKKHYPKVHIGWQHKLQRDTTTANSGCLKAADAAAAHVTAAVRCTLSLVGIGHWQAATVSLLLAGCGSDMLVAAGPLPLI